MEDSGLSAQEKYLFELYSTGIFIAGTLPEL